MKCPRCDTDITGKRKCSKCGLGVADFKDEIEVVYKDFKTSELLDIRHKKQAAYEHEEIKPVREHKGEKTAEREEGKPFPSLAALALILTVIAGACFIFGYFIMR